MSQMSYLNFGSLIITVAAFVISVILVNLYFYAYLRMKRSPVILSVTFLCLSIAIKLFFMCIMYSWVIFKDSSSNIGDSVAGAVQIIPNAIILAALIYFLYHSVKTPNKELIEKFDKNIGRR